MRDFKSASKGDLVVGNRYNVVSYSYQIGTSYFARGKEFYGVVERFIFEDDKDRVKVFFEGSSVPYLLKDLEII